ncbi:MAG: ABC transporter ATP-binding protein [Lachnospiraceae bacterium]|nr:ABC transporter ATP-binding protein [Lachnospiraceae bacterium]
MPCGGSDTEEEVEGAQKPIIEVKNVRKVYKMGRERINAVDGVSFTINEGEFCCLLGTSGSGKSTLLNLIAGIEKVTYGQILIKGRPIHSMSENKLAKFRQNYLGFVFQSYNLMNSMTAVENVELPLVFKRTSARTRNRAARDMLTKVGLGKRMNHKPKEMSGGQQQRVGIARAFVSKPAIVFADEPTGNLDSRTTIEVMQLIKGMASANHQTIVMVTHDNKLAGYADKIIHILDGKIQSIEINENPLTGDADAALKAAETEKQQAGVAANETQQAGVAGAPANDLSDRRATSKDEGGTQKEYENNNSPDNASMVSEGSKEETSK